VTEPDPPFVENGVPIRIDALRKLTDPQLERAIVLSSHSVGGSDILAERARREANERTKTIAKWTKAVGIMTLVIAIATIVNVVVFILR
jgi:hypothetical protein